jgi:hypothetical protein
VPVNTCRVRLRYALLRVRRYDGDYHAREAGLVDFIKARGSAKPDVADLSCGSRACGGNRAARRSECPALRRAFVLGADHEEQRER